MVGVREGDEDTAGGGGGETAPAGDGDGGNGGEGVGRELLLFVEKPPGEIDIPRDDSDDVIEAESASVKFI